MAIKQVEEISKKVAKSFQSDVDIRTKETINKMLFGINTHIDSFKFHDVSLDEHQINIENPSLLEEKFK